MTGGALWRQYVHLSQQDPDKRDWTYDCDGHPVPMVDGEPDYTRRYTIDMTGTGDYINDPSDCAPPRDDEWMTEYVQLHVDNELHRVSWMEREKKIASASREVRMRLAAGREER